MTSLISSHLKLSLNIHDRGCTVPVLYNSTSFTTKPVSLMSNEVLVGVIEGLTTDTTNPGVAGDETPS